MTAINQETNQLNIELPDSGMLYYINNIFASDFIHDFRFGGAGTERLNSLANKVEEIRKMIGFSSEVDNVQNGGDNGINPLTWFNNDDRYKTDDNKKEQLLFQKQYDDKNAINIIPEKINIQISSDSNYLMILIGN